MAPSGYALAPMSLRFAAAILAVLLLAFPAGALAQSAGDDQYADPFELPESENGGGEEQPAPTEAPAPAEPAAQATGETTAETGSTTEAAPGAALPRSGLPLGVVAGAGGLLFAAGFTLRRRA
jgi:hypothetical protein